MNKASSTLPAVIASSLVPETTRARDESRLLRDALAGDGRAFAALVKPHLTMLYRLAARSTSHPSLADDAVQEALVIVYQRLAHYRPGTSLKAWMATITVRRIKTLARGERRREARELDFAAPAPLAGPSAQLAAKDLGERLRAALEALPTKRRQAVLLRLDAGLSFAEIAQATGSTEGSVRVLVHLGMKAIRATLADDDREKGQAND
ncbi:MAG: RNA polymerase sigma factor [Myxococcota bacterium]